MTRGPGTGGVKLLKTPCSWFPSRGAAWWGEGKAATLPPLSLGASQFFPSPAWEGTGTGSGTECFAALPVAGSRPALLAGSAGRELENRRMPGSSCGYNSSYTPYRKRNNARRELNTTPPLEIPPSVIPL